MCGTWISSAHHQTMSLMCSLQEWITAINFAGEDDLVKFCHAKDLTLVVKPGAIGSSSQNLEQNRILNDIS